MIDSDDPYNEILKIKVGLDKYYVKRKGFWQDLKLVGITILSLFIPKKMGHYLLINLLKIEDNNEFKLREIISNVKIKNIDQSEIKEDTTANLRIMVLADVIAVLCGFIFALYIRNDFLTPGIFLGKTIFHILGVCVAAKLLSFYLFGLYKGMWRYTSVVDIFNIAKANAFGTLTVVAVLGYFRGFQDIPRAVFVIDLILTFGFTSFLRLGIRLIYSHLINPPKPYRIELSKRVVLIGAGTTGEFICKELLNDSIHQMEPIGFLDDNNMIHGRHIHGKEVLGKVNDLAEFVT